jgi:hypothetical protein
MTPSSVGYRLAIPVFPFLRVLNLTRTHLLTATPLTGESGKDIPLLLEALARGRACISCDRFRPVAGFSLPLTAGGRSATLREDFPLDARAE